jgi:esterase/lipase
MKTFLKILPGVIGLLVLAYFLGPRPPAPTFGKLSFALPDSLFDLEKQINSEERKVRGIKPDNQARIVWPDSTRKQKTRTVFLYLHGFTGSMGDGKPVHADLARSFNSNLYLFRNAHHGVDLGDSTMLNAKPDDYVYEAEKALAITKRLGDEVIVIGTSFGGTLALYLASKHPEIKAVVLYSPGLSRGTLDEKVVTGPWGPQLIRKLMGSDFIDNRDTVKTHRQYWQMHVHSDGIVSVISLVTHAMTTEAFAHIKCPVFLGYYYKNDEDKDNAISVKAMQAMFDQLGTPPALKKQMAFSDAGDHVIASELISPEWMHVEKETEKWIREVVFR